MSKKLLRKKLDMYLATLKKKRPYYCEVEYLQSTGTQYIDTGFYGTLNTKIEAKVYSQRASSSDSGYCIAGDFTTSTKAITMPFNFTSDGLYSRFGDKAITSGIQQEAGAYTFAVDKAGYYVNGTKIANFNTTTDFTTTGTIMLLGFTGLGRNYFIGKTYYCKIYDNDALVKDLIPVLDWNMTPCMYDKVTGQLFYNAGTGDFSYGREIHYVDYLESTGTAYIDTGITINTSTDEVVSDFQLISTTLYRWIMGEHDNGARFGIGVGDGTNLRNIAYGANTYKVQDAQVYNEKHNFKANSNGVFLDDVQIQGYENFASASTVYLFDLNISGAGRGASGRIWRYTHKRNGVLIRDYLPAIDENGVGFMFDRVTHSCFLNTGTDAFKYPAREIEYLSSTGTQYINTGFMPNQDTKIEVIGKFTNSYPACLYATRWSQSPSYDTYGAYAENNSQGMLYIYYGRYSDGNFVGVSNATFPYRDGNFIKFIQDKNTLNFTNLGTDDNWTYTFNETTFQSTRALTLFYFSSSSSFATRGGTIKTAKIWDNGTLTRNYVSAYKDGVLGMYDKANDIFYPNGGSGTFTTGKIIEPEYES